MSELNTASTPPRPRAVLCPTRDADRQLDHRHPTVTPMAIAAILGEGWKFAGGRPQPNHSYELRFELDGRVTEAVVIKGRISFRRPSHQWSTSLAQLARQPH